MVVWLCGHNAHGKYNTNVAYGHTDIISIHPFQINPMFAFLCRPIYATIYMPYWLRLMGAQGGQAS